MIAKTAGDYGVNSFQKVYWITNDGNIRYAKYQSEEQIKKYLTNNDYESVVSEVILNLIRHLFYFGLNH